MLVLARRAGERFVFPQLGITVTLVKLAGQVATLGIDAPREVEVHRSEVLDRIRREGQRKPAVVTP